MLCRSNHTAIWAQHANFTAMQRQLKRRSADVGGLHLATGNEGQGKGWVGEDIDTEYAELLSDMYNQTLNAVNENIAPYEEAVISKPARSRLIRLLDCWHFEPHKLSEDEVLGSTVILFEVLYRIEGMEQAIGVSSRKIAEFIHHLRQIYRYENTYHNYEHALDVLQATQCYMVAAQMVPPVTILLEPGKMWTSPRRADDTSLVNLLRLKDILAIYLAAIGHDVGHPGFTNVFMKNAQTPLSKVYDGKSPLEHLHAQLLIRIMRRHNLDHLLDDPEDGSEFKRLLKQTVLYTDMTLHEEFILKFQEELNGKKTETADRRILVAQAILKNADISNPSRPFPVAQHWATALMEEWQSQKNLEEILSLAQTVQPSENPLGVAKSQIFFISTFAKPLLDITSKCIKEMDRYAHHCNMNLERWLQRRDELESRPDTSTTAPQPPTSPRIPNNYQSAFPLTLPQGQTATPLITPSTSMAGSIASEDSSVVVSPSESSASTFSPEPQFIHPFLSPGSDSSSSGRGTNGVAPSIAPSTSSHIAENEVIRAAGKNAMRQLRKPNRNSWCVNSEQFAGMIAMGSSAVSSSLFSPLSSSSISASDRPSSPEPPFVPPPATAPSQLGANSSHVTVAVPVSPKGKRISSNESVASITHPELVAPAAPPVGSPAKGLA